jgi:hypothetical protein
VLATRSADIAALSIVDEAGFQVKPSAKAFGKHSLLCGAPGAGPAYSEIDMITTSKPAIREAARAWRMHDRLVDGCKQAHDFVRELAAAGLRYDKRDKLEKLLDGLLKEAQGKD